VSARTIFHLGRWQASQGVQGAVGEIGVHHGRLFVLLDLLRVPGERSFAVDLFDEQHLNVDRSGEGDLDAFLRNVNRHVGSHLHVAVFSGSSSDLHPSEILEAVGRVRLMSVDGGHTSELTLNDLQIAHEVLTADGLVVVDDFFNYLWPGVMSGVVAYLSKHDGLVPIGLSPNKLYLTRPASATQYREALGSAPAGFRSYESELLGQPIAVVQGFSGGMRGVAERAYGAASRAPVVAPLARGLRTHFRAR
jgi:hypothetical protein